MTEVTSHAPVRVYVWFSRFTERNVIICWEYPLEGFPGGSDGKASACNAGDLRSVPELGNTTSVLTSFTTIQRFPETPISSL